MEDNDLVYEIHEELEKDMIWLTNMFTLIIVAVIIGIQVIEGV